MHPIQEKLIALSKDHDVVNMRLTELAKLAGANYLQQVKHHRQMLIRKNLLAEPEDSKEVLREKGLLGSDAQLIRIPVLGSVNAGPASVYADGKVSGYLRVSSSRLPIRVTNKLYALKVVGNSMNRAKIGPLKLAAEQGDYIIADGKSYDSRSGDYVVSLIEGMANVKKLVVDKSNSQVALLSESSDDYPPIIIDLADEVDYLAQSEVVHVVKAPEAS